MSVPERQLLRITDSESQYTMTEYGIQPIQFTSMRDVKNLFEKLTSLGVIKLDEDNNISEEADPAALDRELLFSSDGKTYLKSEVCALAKEEAAELQIFFIKQTSANDFHLVKANEIEKNTCDYIVNRLFARALRKLDLHNGFLRGGLEYHSLTESFESTLSFINPALESLMWVLCQNLIRHVDMAESPEVYESCLQDFKQFFTYKKAKIKEFSDYLEKISQESAILTKVRDQNLAPSELRSVICADLGVEERAMKMKQWEEMRSDRLYVEVKNLNYAWWGFTALSIVGSMSTPVYLAGMGLYYGLLIYNIKKTHEFHSDQEKMPGRLAMLTSQMPTLNYLTSVMANILEQLELKLSVIEAEIKASQYERIGSVTIEEVPEVSTLASIISFSSALIFRQLEIKDAATLAIIAEPEEEVEEKIDDSQKAEEVYYSGNEIVEDVTDEANPRLLKRRPN